VQAFGVLATIALCCAKAEVVCEEEIAFFWVAYI
jgi:hypothetical protein